MNFIQALKKRYATKRMTATKINPSTLENIVQAIHLSPSSFGLQPYQILVVQNEKIKSDIQKFCFNQPVIVECDALIIICALKTIHADTIKQYIQDVSEKRKIPIEKLQDYQTRIIQKIENISPSECLHWASKQCYIALGIGLAACAIENVDSCPIEGFEPNKIDDYFELDNQNLQSCLMLAIGNKDEKTDFNFNVPKYRKNAENFISWKK